MMKELHTEELLFRPIQVQDAAALFPIRAHPLVHQHIERPPAQSLSDVEAFLQRATREMAERNWLLWAICLKKGGNLIGSIGFWRIEWENRRAEIGYELHPDHWGKRYATAAVKTVSAYGLSQVGFHSIVATVNPTNLGSIKVLENCGYLREGYFRENVFHRGQFWDTAVYTLLERGESEE